MKSRNIAVAATIAMGAALSGCGSHHDSAPNVTSSYDGPSTTPTTSTTRGTAPSRTAMPSTPARTGAPGAGRSAASRAAGSGGAATTGSGHDHSTDGSPRTNGSGGGSSTSAANDTNASGSVSSRVRQQNTSDAESVRGSSTRSSDVPVSISIPSIGLYHSIRMTRGNGSTFEPTPGTIQQYLGLNRVLPGQKGISLLAGHVTYYGPDVFYRLGSLHSGSIYSIRYADGSTRSFRVRSVESINKYQLEHDQRLWGDSNTPVVALVTCDAESAWATRGHHANNLVVWSVPA